MGALGGPAAYTHFPDVKSRLSRCAPVRSRMFIFLHLQRCQELACQTFVQHVFQDPDGTKLQAFKLGLRQQHHHNTAVILAVRITQEEAAREAQRLFDALVAGALSGAAAVLAVALAVL